MWDLCFGVIISSGWFRLHIAFGRLNGYVINPNQELIAIGVTNTVGSCFGAYPATGSFSRTALKSKSGVRTPAAGILTAAVVIVALYGLTEAFFWIPTAGLSAIIIHAVADLIASPSQVTNPRIFYKYYLINRIPGLFLLACCSPWIRHLVGSSSCHRIQFHWRWTLHLDRCIVGSPVNPRRPSSRRLLGQSYCPW